MLPGPVDCHSGVVHAIHDIDVTMLSGDRRYHGSQMLVVVGRGAQCSVDVPREGDSVSEDSPAVMSHVVPRAAEHEENP